MHDIINKFQGKKVLVIGDIMLDHYIFGRVSRISPEAPVPVLNKESESFSPGGAANVSINLKSLGAHTSLIGIVGKDNYGKEILSRLKKSGVNCDHILLNDKKSTTVKSRIVSSSQQILRIDSEDTEYIESFFASGIVNSFKKHLKSFKPHAVIISDYSKGLLTKSVLSSIISECNKSGIFTAADPKGNDFTKYKGVNLITPNITEAEHASGIMIKDDAALLKAVKKIFSATKADCVLITMGSKGLSYKVKKNKLKSVSTDVKEVFDVTGAGDTFISAFVLTYLSTSSYDISAELANRAAGISVTKFGVAHLIPSELLSDKESETKVTTLDKLSGIILKYKKENKKIVFTNGCFDLFHHGHLSILKKSKQIGDILIVALNKDESVKKLKGDSRPVVKEKERSEIISSLESVDHVLLFSEDTPLKIIKEIKPDYITKGSDYNKQEVVGKEFIESYGGKVVIIPLEKNLSTTKIIEKLKDSS